MPFVGLGQQNSGRVLSSPELDWRLSTIAARSQWLCGDLAAFLCHSGRAALALVRGEDDDAIWAASLRG